MSRTVVRSLKLFVLVFAFSAVWMVAGCQTAGETESAATTSTTGGDRRTDAFAGSDAERAEAAMQDNRAGRQRRRPRIGNDRSGSRVVDQPVRRP